MRILNKLRRVEIGITVGILGVLLTVFSIYATLKEDKPHISFDIINTTNVLAIDEPLDDLMILFNEEDIQKENLNLKIISIRVENDGGLDILQNQYDRTDIWGIKLSDGDIIEARLVGSNSEYIRSNINPTLNDNVVKFEKVIFERGKNFVIELLILHEKTLTPKLEVMGKIAGIEGLAIAERLDDDGGIVNRAFSGNLWIQLIRLLVYFVGGIIILVISVVLGFLIEDPISNRRRETRKKKFRKLIVNFSEKEKAKYKKQLSALEEIYVSGGEKALDHARDIFNNEEKTKFLYKEAEDWINKRPSLEELHTLEGLEKDERRIYYRPANSKGMEIMENVVEHGFVTLNNDKPVIDKALMQFLNMLLNNNRSQ